MPKLRPIVPMSKVLQGIQTLQLNPRLLLKNVHRYSLLKVVPASTPTVQKVVPASAPTVQKVVPVRVSTVQKVVPVQTSKSSILQSSNIVSSDNGLFFVYLDIIAPRRIGANCNRVLKIINPQDKRTFHFNNVEYVPVERNYFDSFSVLVTQSDGKNVNFASSNIPTYINLHFKRVPPIY